MNLTFKIIFVISILSSSSISFSEESDSLLKGWVGLWNDEMIEWAENKNRISKLCPKILENNELKKCKDNFLSEKKWTIDTYKQSNLNSKKVGKIVILVKPGKSLETVFKGASGETTVFIPDLYDQDWGYGPYLHQTILEQKEDWVKIPLPGTVRFAWINPRKDIRTFDIKPITKERVYKYRNGSIVIVDASRNAVKYRLENKSDMWCDIGQAPKVPAGKIKTLSTEKLFENGHLTIDLKYKRGC